jgi:hypothetical protein
MDRIACGTRTTPARPPRHDPVGRLNQHHTEDLAIIARANIGPDATAARANRVGPDGIVITADTPGGRATARIAFAAPAGVRRSAGLRIAFRDLTRQAEARLARDRSETSAR